MVTGANGWTRVRRAGSAGLMLVAIAGLTGCVRSSGPRPHEALSGTIESFRSDSGLLMLRLTEARVRPERAARVTCLLDSDAEIYVNDMLVPADAIRVGDLVELVGYTEPNTQPERFVIRLARIARPQPPPAEPDLTPVSGAATPRQES